MSNAAFALQPPTDDCYKLAFPSEGILLIILSNPRSLNCIPSGGNWALDALFQWYDNEPSLRCCVITGQGRAFCAGADLKEWNQTNERAAKGGAGLRHMPPSGFGGVSRRSGKKPVIGAINGLAYGGGMEMVANMDMVIASKSAMFSLPEVKRGVAAIAGSLPRLMRTLGRSRAMELALTGRSITAAEAKEWGLLNAITEDAPVDAEVTSRPVVQKALEYATTICSNSPDAVIVSRAGVIEGWEDGSAEHGTISTIDVWQRRLIEGENMREGVKAFVEKREPQWVGSKL
jgi:enoyl-CoA hydratase/carnithine racemase